jgi:hypothetical protein
MVLGRLLWDIVEIGCLIVAWLLISVRLYLIELFVLNCKLRKFFHFLNKFSVFIRFRLSKRQFLLMPRIYSILFLIFIPLSCVIIFYSQLVILKLLIPFQHIFNFFIIKLNQPIQIIHNPMIPVIITKNFIL